MALSAELQRDTGLGPYLTGIVLSITPSEPGWRAILDRAPDNGSGAPDTGNAVEIATLEPGSNLGWKFTDPLPRDGAKRFYRFRLVREGYVDGNYSDWTSGHKPVSLVRRFGFDIFRGDPVYPFDRTVEHQDGGFAALAIDGGGISLDAAVGVAEGGATYKIFRHGEVITVSGPDADGDVSGLTFGQTYQQPPLLTFKGGQYVAFSSTLGTGSSQRRRLQAFDVTASGFKSRAQIIQSGTTTARTADFASGNLLDAVGETAEVDLGTNVPANDDTYTINYRVSVTVDANVSQYCTATLTVALESNDGGGWVERATYVYAVSPTAGPPPYSQTTKTWDVEAKPIVVSGIGANDDLRIRAKTFTVSNGGTGSFAVRGADAGGTNPDTRNGVLWTTATDTTESAIPNAGDHVIWAAQEVT